MDGDTKAMAGRTSLPAALAACGPHPSQGMILLQPCCALQSPWPFKYWNKAVMGKTYFMYVSTCIYVYLSLSIYIFPPSMGKQLGSSVTLYQWGGDMLGCCSSELCPCI